MTAREPTTAYGINGKTVQGSWEQLSSFLLLCRVTWMWRSHCSPRERKSPSGGVCVGGGGDACEGSFSDLSKIRVSKTKRTVEMKSWQSPREDDHIWNLTEKAKLCPMPLPVQQENTDFFWSSSWPSVLKARTFELKSKTCKLLENSLVDDQHLVWSGRLSPSSTSSRWRFEPRFEPKLFPQADTWALHLGIKGPVGLHCAQPPSTFICSPERGLAGLCPLADSCSCNLSSPGQDQVVEIRNWD